jgi:hypothetical protein
LDVSRLPDDVTFNDPQPRMLEAVRNESGRAPRTIHAKIVALLPKFVASILTSEFRSALAKTPRCHFTTSLRFRALGIHRQRDPLLKLDSA